VNAYFGVYIALPVPEIIAIEVLGGGCELPILGKRRPYGAGDAISMMLYLYAFERYCRFCAPARHFLPPTSTVYSLPQISPCSAGSRRVAYGLLVLTLTVTL